MPYLMHDHVEKIGAIQRIERSVPGQPVIPTIRAQRLTGMHVERGAEVGQHVVATRVKITTCNRIRQRHRILELRIPTR